MLNGLLDKIKRKEEKKKAISSILKVKTKDGNLYFVIPNISCVSDVQEDFVNDEEIYTIEIYTSQNKVQISLSSKTKAMNRRNKIIKLIERWWIENGCE